MEVPGVVSADVDCSSGRAVCEVKIGTDPELLVQAVELSGFTTTVLGTEPAKTGQ